VAAQSPPTATSVTSSSHHQKSSFGIGFLSFIKSAVQLVSTLRFIYDRSLNSEGNRVLSSSSRANHFLSAASKQLRFAISATIPSTLYLSLASRPVPAPGLVLPVFPFPVSSFPPPSKISATSILPTNPSAFLFSPLYTSRLLSLQPIGWIFQLHLTARLLILQRNPTTTSDEAFSLARNHSTLGNR
jgi:hypothetical protein